MVVSSAVEAHFQRECSVHNTPRKGNGKKCKQRKSWTKSAGKRKSEEGKGDGKYKGQSKGSNSASGSYKSKPPKTGLFGLDNRKPETNSEIQEFARMYRTDHSYTDNSWLDDGCFDHCAEFGFSLRTLPATLVPSVLLYFLY